jgi:voltage-dependent anion channel protein 2
MSPPSFSDLGKSARDLFSKGYHFGQYKVEAKTKTQAGVEFTTSGSNSHDTGLFNGNLESKFKWKDYGATFTEKWSTDNTLATELAVEDQLLKGLKLSLDSKFSPVSGKKSGKVKTEYQQDYIHTNLDFDVTTFGVLGSFVAGYQGFLGGYQLNFDSTKTEKSLLAQSNFAAGYSKDDLNLYWAVNGGSEFLGSVFHKVTKDLESGITMSWVTGTSETRFGFGAKYNADKDTTFRAKVNNASQIGLSYQQKLRDGVTLTLSTQIEGKSLNAGGHKFGLALDFEA